MALSLQPRIAPADAKEREFHIDWRVHASVIVVAGLVWILPKDAFIPERCRWCAGNAFDDAVRGGLRWSDTGLADDLSDWTGLRFAPVSAFGFTALAAAYDHRLDRWPTDALLIAEAMVLTEDLTSLTKLAVARQRPFVRAGLAEAPDPGDNLSFFSGHTSRAFSAAAAAGTVASLRGYRMAPIIWAVGGAAAVTTGWLRIAADKHYATDVLVGAAVGSAIGVGWPLLFARGQASTRPVSLELHPVPHGAFVSTLGFW